MISPHCKLFYFFSLGLIIYILTYPNLLQISLLCYICYFFTLFVSLLFRMLLSYCYRHKIYFIIISLYNFISFIRAARKKKSKYTFLKFVLLNFYLLFPVQFICSYANEFLSSIIFLPQNNYTLIHFLCVFIIK